MGKYSFINIQLEEKNENEWRAFLRFIDYEENLILGIRGYGSSPGEAADDAWADYQEGLQCDFEFSSFDHAEPYLTDAI